MMLRICAVALLVTFGVALSASAQTAPSRSAESDRQGVFSGQAGASRSRANDNAAAALLRKRVESVDWVDTPFEEVIDWLKGESDGRVNIRPLWSKLGNENVDVDTPVTLQLSDTTVADVLNEVIESASPDGEVTYHAFRNTIRISTKADFDRKMYREVYDVADILFRVPDFGRTAPMIDLQQTASGGGGGGGGRSVFTGGGSGQDQGETGEQAEQELKTRLEEMATMIKDIIAPESWRTPQGGGRGNISVFNRSLIVYNTAEVHEEIAGAFSLSD